MKSFWLGFKAPLSATKSILKSPVLMGLVAVPLALNICLYLAFFHYGAGYCNRLIADWISDLSTSVPTWMATSGLLTLSRWFLKLLAWVTLGLVAAISFTIVSGVVSAPFNDSLSKAVARKHASTLGLPPLTELRFGIGHTIRLEAKRMVVLIGGAVLVMILGLIPFLQIPALVIGAYLLAFEYFGYPISHRSSSLWPVWGFLIRYPFVSLGFGCFLLLMMAVPFASIFYIPLAVVGGTTLYTDCTKAKRK